MAKTYTTETGVVATFKVAALNLDAISDNERYDGFYGICTDLNNPVKEIIGLNHNRWESEDCFRLQTAKLFMLNKIYLKTSQILVQMLLQYRH